MRSFSLYSRDSFLFLFTLMTTQAHALTHTYAHTPHWHKCTHTHLTDTNAHTHTLTNNDFSKKSGLTKLFFLYLLTLLSKDAQRHSLAHLFKVAEHRGTFSASHPAALGSNITSANILKVPRYFLHLQDVFLRGKIKRFQSLRGKLPFIIRKICLSSIVLSMNLWVFRVSLSYLWKIASGGCY